MKFIAKNLIKIVIALVLIVSITILVLKVVTENQPGNSAEERALIAAAKKYYENKKGELPKENYQTVTVSSSILISNGYLEPTVDKDGNTISCSSYVTVVKSNDLYSYNPYIKCGKGDDTVLLYDKLMENAIETYENKNGTNGLFKTNNEYTFRGDNPLNYVKFANRMWRIVKIDENRNIKLIYAESSYEPKPWDDRYNVDRKSNTGINDYKVSTVRDYIYKFFNADTAFSDASRARVAPIDICIGKRPVGNLSTDGSIECSTKMQNEMIYLIQASEYLNASNDPSCPNVNIVACQNYNFLSGVRSYWSITATEGSTSQAYRIIPETGLVARDTNTHLNVLPLISLRSDTIYYDGNGTKETPYLVR